MTSLEDGILQLRVIGLLKWRRSIKRTPINRYSLKKISEIQGEAPIRIKLCKRAGGIPATREVQIYRNGQKYTHIKVECIGGVCECGLTDCPKYPSYGQHLEPHEKVFRSRGGKLSMSNSIMVLRRCHRILQKREPRWSKA